MNDYIGKLQAKIYYLEEMVRKAKLAEEWYAYMFADEMLTEAIVELKQARWMEENK